MLRRDRQIRTQIRQVSDAALFAFSFWAAYELRGYPQICAWLNCAGLNLEPISAETFHSVVWLFAVLIPTAPFILESQGLYNHPIPCPRQAIFWSLLKGCLLTTLSLVVVMYALHITAPRGVMMFFGGISFSMIYLKEELLRAALYKRLSPFRSRRRFILAGTDKEIAKMRRELIRQTDESTEVVAELNLVEKPVEKIIPLLHDHSIYGVILSAKHTYFEQVEYIIRACELEGVEVWLLADFFNTQISHTNLDEWFGHPLLIFRTAPETSWQILVKQLIDLFGSLFLLIAFSWLFALIALVIKFTSPGPVFFRQQRSGLNGAPFMLYKFRTMVTNAEQFKHELEAMNEMRGPVFKVTNDPRITPVGKFIRKYSLDELPQLLNVLYGEMSLVGPRPLPVDEVKRFNDLSHRRRLSVKPGLTCIWQVTGRNRITDFKDWVRLDLEYIDNWSLWLDLKILLRTIPAVLIGTGAK